jgi:hypothetical protein
MEFMLRFGLKRADEVVYPAEIPEERRKTSDWKNYREELGCREAERRIARGDNLLLVATELEVPMGATFVTINSKLAQFPGRAARFMVMKRDEAEAEQTLRDEIDAVLLDLNLANYIDTSIGAVVSEFPFDRETEELYKRVSFSGQDHAALMELIRLSVTETLRRIGRRALQSADNQPISSAEESNLGKSSALEEKKAQHTEEQPIVSRHGNKSADTISARSSRKRRSVTRARKRGVRTKSHTGV